MKKAQIIEAIQIRLGNGILTPEVKKKYHENLIEKYTIPIYNEILYNAFFSGNASLDGYTKRFWKVAVSKDSDTNVYYSILPCNLATLPNPQDAVRAIYYSSTINYPSNYKIVGDTYSQLSQLALSGITENNSDSTTLENNYILYAKIAVSGSFGNPKEVTLYSDVDKTNAVAYGYNSTSPGIINLGALNSSGITGSVYLTYSEDAECVIIMPYSSETVNVNFQPVSFDDLTTKKNLLINQISTTIGYTLCLRDQSNAVSETILDNENYIVEYDGLTTANAVEYVSMRIVPAFDGFNDNDEIRIPVFKGMNLIDRVVQFFITTPPKDLKFNNSDLKA